MYLFSYNTVQLKDNVPVNPKLQHPIPPRGNTQGIRRFYPRERESDSYRPGRGKKTLISISCLLPVQLIARGCDSVAALLKTKGLHNLCSAFGLRRIRNYKVNIDFP